MKRIILIVFATLIGFSILIFGAYFVINKKLNVNPQILNELRRSPKRNIAELFPQGEDLESPLKVQNGLRIALFADVSEFGQPRVLKFDPNGVLFASLTAAGKIIAMPDINNDGIADEIKVVKDGLNRPHGVAFGGKKVFIAESNKVVTYDYDPVSLVLSNPSTIITLPEGGRHYTRTININGDKLYTSVGSSCDVCVEEDEERASIFVSDLDGENLKIFAKGLRNTVFFTFDSKNQLWGNDMGRDFLGDDLPPDELNIIEDGKDYGWPRCYGDRVRDLKFRNWESIDYCNQTQPSFYNYPAHAAPLGIAIIDSPLFNEEEQGDILTSFHGSWNSTVPVGYKIVKLNRNSEGKVESMEDLITGWIEEGTEILGRPVDLVFDDTGLLYMSDDRAGVIYILTKNGV